MILFRGPITWFFWLATLVTVFAITRSIFSKSTQPQPSSHWQKLFNYSFSVPVAPDQNQRNRHHARWNRFVARAVY